MGLKLLCMCVLEMNVFKNLDTHWWYWSLFLFPIKMIWLMENAVLYVLAAFLSFSPSSREILSIKISISVSRNKNSDQIQAMGKRIIKLCVATFPKNTCGNENKYQLKICLLVLFLCCFHINLNLNWLI